MAEGKLQPTEKDAILVECGDWLRETLAASREEAEDEIGLEVMS